MELCKSNPKLERACHGLFQPDLFISVPAAVSGGVFPLPQRSGVFSLIFYAWGEPVYLFLMIAAAAVNWGFGLLIEKRHKRVFLVLALVLDLGCLAVFKYTGFVVENLNALFGASIPVPAIALPIGISFYTFQALSYTVDVWRGDPGAAVVCKIPALHLALPAAHRRADRPLCRRRRADRRAQL